MCTIWSGIWKYVIKTAGLFTSFLAKVLQRWENRNYEKKHFHFQGPLSSVTWFWQSVMVFSRKGRYLEN